jgi:hypothetical protein
VLEGYQVEHEVYNSDGRWVDTKCVKVCLKDDTTLYTEKCPLDEGDYVNIYVREVSIDNETLEVVVEHDRGYYETWR